MYVAAKKSLATALAGAAIAGTVAVPAAQSMPSRDVSNRDVSSRAQMQTSSLAGTTSSQDLRMPDTRDAAAGRKIADSPTVVTVRPAPSSTPADGFDWSATALGAAGGAGLVILLFAAGGLVRRRPLSRGHAHA
jgi:hypothetical protein